jgi:uncharacterized protein (UPF0332 family)
MAEVMLSEKLYRVLEAEAGKMGVSVEGLIIDILSRALNTPLNPRDRAEFHLRLCEKYLRESEESLAKSDYAQASGKAWGAAAQIVKAVAAREGREPRGHAELWRFVDELAKRLNDIELRRLWRTANALHQNFYENLTPPDDVKYAIEDVKEFIEKLRKTYNNEVLNKQYLEKHVSHQGMNPHNTAIKRTPPGDNGL